jgi:hypothetical protein
LPSIQRNMSKGVTKYLTTVIAFTITLLPELKEGRSENAENQSFANFHAGGIAAFRGDGAGPDH